MTVGAYAFCTKDWKEMGFPLDLWVKHNSKFFDELSLVVESGTELEFPTPDNVNITEVLINERANWDFYRINKTKAMTSLHTDWKMLLDIDEFVGKRIDEKRLHEEYVYGTNHHHLFGSVETEILYVFPDYYWRLHYGNKTVLNDGGSVDGRRRFKLRKFSEILKEPKIRTLKHDGLRRLLLMPKDPIEVFHTSMVRDPHVLLRKWIAQTNTDPVPNNDAYHLQEKVYESENPYQALFGYWKEARISPINVPESLKRYAFAEYVVKNEL